MRSIIEFAYPHGLSVPACYMAASRRALSYSARLPFDLHYGWLIVVVYMVPITPPTLIMCICTDKEDTRGADQE